MDGKIAGPTALTDSAPRIPRQARAVARVGVILETANQLLRQGGTAAVTTTALAGAAQIPVGSIYRYFRDRDDILWQIYRAAYDDVAGDVSTTLAAQPKGQAFEITNKALLESFWSAARTHPTFRTLTRWANSQGSLWEVTPGPNSGLQELVEASLNHSGIVIEAARKPAVLKTVVTALSILIDQALEEEDETIAGQLIEELARLISSYIGKA